LKRQAGLPPGGFTETLYLRVSEQGRLIKAIGKIVQTQHRGDMAGIFSFLFAKIARFKLILSHLKPIIERIMKEPKITNRDVNNRILIQNIIVNRSF